MKKKNLALITAATMIAIAATGCGNTQTPQAAQPEEPQAVGLLSVNPEIHIEYDKESNDKNIALKLEKGSHVTFASMAAAATEMIDNGYITLEKAKEIALAQAGVAEATFTEADYDRYEDENRVNQKQQESSKPNYISLEEAKAAALKYLGADAAAVKCYEADLDDGIYELEFVSEDMEYDVDVRAKDGTVLRVEKDYNDDKWDD